MRRLLLALFLAVAAALPAVAADGPGPRAGTAPLYPPAPDRQHPSLAAAKSEGCVTCHEKSDTPSMHANPAVVLGCVDCHGGEAKIARPAGTRQGDAAYADAMAKAHVKPYKPEFW